MVSVDKVLDKHSKRQKYLGLRIFMIFLLVIFAMDTLFDTKQIDKVTVFNTLMLLFAPLSLEYFFGMNAYSGFTNTFRWLGLLISIFVVIVCFLGYMGKVEITLNESEKLHEILFFGEINLSMIIIWLSYIIIANTFFDYIFTFNKKEMEYYSLHKDLEEFLDQKYTENKANATLEGRKQKFKKEILSNLQN